MRIAEIEDHNNVRFRLRPFYLVNIMKEMGHVPFVDEPAKLAYMWRDIDRQAKRRGLTPRIPAPFPTQHTDFANRVAYVALRQPWGRDYVLSSYRAWFEHGHPPGEEPNITKCICALGQDVEKVKAEARDSLTHDAMMAETDIARSLGIFGSPTFAVGRELFWGDDRLEDAVAWVAS